MLLKFESELKESPDNMWKWITSSEGLNHELFPILHMSSLSNFSTKNLDTIELGVPITRSWLLLFGLLPIGFSELTLVELNVGERFIEQSKMSFMKSWRHERIIIPHGAGTIIRDVLTYEPIISNQLCTFFIKLLFRNRHKKLRNRFVS
jgi:ligand-binding SRPBCC domain-containing protein